MPALKWIETTKRMPPIGRRLLFMMRSSPFAQLEGPYEVEVGYWDGDHFRFMRGDDMAQLVTRWALLAPGLPKKGVEDKGRGTEAQRPNQS